MTGAKGREPVYCARVRWDGERVDLRFPTHGVDECRAVGRGVEVHGCGRRAGHGEDQLVHVCYCGLAWSGDGPDAAEDGAVGILTGPSRVGTDTAPEGTSRLGEVPMVREDCWREVHRLFYRERRSKLEIALRLGLDRKTVRGLLRAEAWRPYARAASAATLLTPYAAQVQARAPAVAYSARIVFQELRQQGYGSSYETIKRFVRPLRAANQAAERIAVSAHIGFTTPHGRCKNSRRRLGCSVTPFPCKKDEAQGQGRGRQVVSGILALALLVTASTLFLIALTFLLRG